MEYCRIVGICDCGEIVEWSAKCTENDREDYGLTDIPEHIVNDVVTKTSDCSYCKQTYQLYGVADPTQVGMAKF